MSLALSSGLLFAPALASRLNQPPPPSAILAGADDDAELAAVAEPLGDIFAPLTAEPAAEDEVAAAFGPDAAE
ncbi:MAG: hypothetical protein M3N68_00700, partial [Actinomycetota bacterium]|nr:hypothetical protein [Actinomycetota bacterium]